jgi:AraC-like DNA-binding protein
VLWVSHRPYVLDHPGRLSLRVHRLPLRVVGVPESELRRVTARVISPEGGVAAMLAPLLSTLADFAKDCPATVAERLAGNVTDFTATLVAELTHGGREVADEGRRAIVLRIRDYVNHNLGDPTLSPESIAAAHHISTRQLYKLFEGEGATISRWIQRRRLEECRRELARRSSSTQTVFAVARRWGFTDAAYFSRAFRAAYGITPRDWRSSRDSAAPRELLALDGQLNSARSADGG